MRSCRSCQLEFDDTDLLGGVCPDCQVKLGFSDTYCALCGRCVGVDSHYDESRPRAPFGALTAAEIDACNARAPIAKREGGLALLDILCDECQSNYFNQAEIDDWANHIGNPDWANRRQFWGPGKPLNRLTLKRLPGDDEDDADDN